MLQANLATTGSRIGRRAYPRTVFSVPFTMRYIDSNGVASWHGMTVDISEGGLGALIPHQLEIGTTVELQLALRERMLRTAAIVRHAAHGRSGFEFLGLNDEERRCIAQAVA